MLDIREVINRPEYDWINEYRDRLCLLTFGGSHAYGTNLTSSDIDVRGVMLPTKDSLIGFEVEEQRIDLETDTTIFEFNKFVKLVSNCNPNTIEILGTKPETVLIFNDVGLELIKNKNMFISQKVLFSFAGYATSQLRRLENALCHDHYENTDKERHINEILSNLLERLYDKDPNYKDKITVEVVNDEIVINTNLNKYPLRQLIGNLNELNNVIRAFDKLNHRNNKKDEQHLNKHAMHLYRLYLMLFDIIEKEEINTYRHDELPFLMKIRNGEFNLLEKENEFWKEVHNSREKVNILKNNNSLPKKPNYKEIKEFVMNVNEKVIKDEIIQYTEPKLLSNLI